MCFKVAFPFGEDWDCDLLVLHAAGVARVQVKYVTPRDGVLLVRGCSHSLTNGRVRQTKVYTAQMIDVLAAYDAGGGRCYYLPAHELGKKLITLRLGPARNNPADRRTNGNRLHRAAFPRRYLLRPLRGRGANGNTRPLQG